MNGSALLLIHNAGYAVSALLVLFVLAFVAIKGRDLKAKVLFLLAFTSVLVFVVSHAIGVNIHDPLLSQRVLMLNLANLPLFAFLAHFVFVFLGREKEQRAAIIAFYAGSAFLLVFYLFFPETFLLPSHPKLYFPNYYVAGSLDWVMRAWVDVVISGYFFVYMVIRYRTADPVMRNRIKYLFAAIFLAYSFGAMALPLVFMDHPSLFGVTLDPVWSVLFFPFFTIPFAYAAVKYELIDIRIAAKQALGYFVLVELVGVVITLFIVFTDYIRASFPEMPIWLLPLGFAALFVSVGYAVWRRLSETDLLKYEFITVVTHKFRTPLTRIKWAAEEMSPSMPVDKRKSVEAILESERQLMSLTDLLLHLSDADASRFSYRPEPIDLSAAFAELTPEYQARAAAKGVTFAPEIHEGLRATMDPEKTRVIFQILLDNALNYTPSGGTIRVIARPDQDGKHVVVEVKDTGMGMSRETASRVFNRFYRGDNARHADTEGMGIGLFMAKSILEKQGGRISVYSAGPGKGSAFTVRLLRASGKA